MSESSGPHTVNSPKGFRFSAGKTLPGCVTKINNPDKDGNGEVKSNILILKNIYKHLFDCLFIFL